MLRKCVGFEIRDLAVSVETSQDFSCHGAEVRHPILLCWPTTSEANVVDMAVEVEPSRQYSVKFCCRATDDSRGAI